MGNYLIGKGAAASSGIQAKTVHNREKAPVIKFEDLPEDIHCTILSKLSLKEIIRTSVLSSEFRYMWVNCPKLCFDGAQMSGRERCLEKFIDNVNAVLQKCDGHVVEELKVKIGVDSVLVDHLNNWIRFAASSRTKVLAFDLEPTVGSWLRDHLYIFSLELLNNRSISCLQNIQLSFVYLKLPSEFGGFPNLRKLDLSMIQVTRKDLEDMLSSCHNIEWLRLDRCHLDHELQMQGLSNDLYKFSHLRNLKLFMNMNKADADKILWSPF